MGVQKNFSYIETLVLRLQAHNFAHFIYFDTYNHTCVIQYKI